MNILACSIHPTLPLLGKTLGHLSEPQFPYSSKVLLTATYGVSVK